MKKYIAYLVGMLLVLAGCQENDIVQQTAEKQLKTFRATTSAVVKSRAQLNEDHSVSWNVNDVIGVYTDQQAAILPYTCTSATSSEGDFMANADPVTGNIFYAIYPYDESITATGSVITLKFPETQQLLEGTFDPDACPMVARSTTEDLLFKQTTGLICLKLKGTMQLESIVLQGNNGESLSGTATIDLSSDMPELTLTDNQAGKQIVMQGTAVSLNATTEKSFYLVVPPQTFSKGLTFTITGKQNGADVEITKATARSVAVTRSVISSFSAVDVDSELTTEDTSQKEALMALYDAANGDAWTNNANWGTDASLSEWYGVTTDVSGEKVLSLELRENNLTGSIPEELGQLTDLLQLDLSYNSLSGSLPASIGDLTKLVWLGCYGNQLSGEIPAEIGNLTNLAYLGLFSNQLTGEIPAEIGNLTKLQNLQLSNNQLTGTLPASIGNLTDLEQMSVAANNLSGDLPAEVTSQDWWQTAGWDNLIQNGEDGFTIETTNLYLPDFTVQDMNGTTVSSSATVAANDLTVYYIWRTTCSNSQNFHPTLAYIYQSYKNHGLAIIGSCFDAEENEQSALDYISGNSMEWPTLAVQPVEAIHYYYFPMVLAFDRQGKLVFHSHLQDRSAFADFVASCLGEGDKPYESVDYSADGQVFTLQTASQGKGINIVFMGDGFTDRQIADGTYAEIMEKGMEAFFSEQPYTYFRDYFNVYYVNAVSKNEGFITGGETAFSCYFGEGTFVGGDDKKCLEYAKKCGLSNAAMNEVLVITVMNSAQYAGTCNIYWSTANTGDYGNGYAIAYFPLGSDDTEFRKLLLHEAGGHGFAKLLDEYFYQGYRVTEDGINLTKYRQDGFGHAKNIDFTSSETDVIWSKFIADSRYASENIGVYEGGMTCAKGVYRPTDYSIMRNNEGGFNAPSREAIYYRIHKLAYGVDWEYDFETFVEWDQQYGMPSFTAARSSRSMPSNFRPTAPPVFKQGHWADGRIIEE